MHSIEQLKELYEEQFMPQLAEMNTMRRSIKKWKNLAIVSVIIAAIGYYTDPLWVKIVVGGLFTIATLFCAVKAIRKYKKYHAFFKREVVSKIIQLINPEFKYNPEKHIELSEFNRSGIFKTEGERCMGDDLVVGTIDKTPFKFSEIKTEYKTVTTDDDGHKKTEWHQIFRGIFFFAEFNKHIQERTYVLPDGDGEVSNLFGKEKNKTRHHGSMVKLENPEFEDVFSVYGTSQQEARYILTPVMMEAMVNIHKTYGLKMYFSFTGNSVYCAIPFSRNLFEPKINKSGVKFEEVAEMYHLFNLIDILIKQLNLNTRIWTKE